jgi:hypothetical protein
VIKMRYADLPGGLHAHAEARGRHTVIYLLPGLTVSQRRAALRRLRSGARVGHGPRLSGAGIARAAAADRVRTNLKNAAAALRVHPGILAPPLVLSVAAAVAFVLLVPVPVGFNSSSASSPGAVFRRQPPSQTGPLPGLRGGGTPLVPGQRQPRASTPADRPRMSVQLMPDPDQGVEPSFPATAPARPALAPAVKTAPKRTASSSPSASPTASPSPTPSSPQSGSPNGSSPASPSPSPSASTSSASGGLCVTLLVAGVCL